VSQLSEFIRGVRVIGKIQKEVHMIRKPLDGS